MKKKGLLFPVIVVSLYIILVVVLYVAQYAREMK